MSSASTKLQGGLYEIIVNVPDIVSAALHWQAFGYQPVAEGELSHTQAQTLYGVESAALAPGVLALGSLGTAQ